MGEVIMIDKTGFERQKRWIRRRITCLDVIEVVTKTIMLAMVIVLGISIQAGQAAYQNVVTVACVNFKAIVGDKTTNLEKMKQFTIKTANQGANLVAFPELALQGCSGLGLDEVIKLAETIPGPATNAIAKIAVEHNIYVCFGMAEKSNGVIYNSAVVIGPSGVLGIYRKVHIYKPLESWAAAGSEYPLIKIPWGPIGVGICYDNYCFPEVARAYAVRGARLLLHLTAFPEFPGATDHRDFYKTILGARSIENKMFVASANLVGKQGSITFFGYSAIFGPKPGQMNYHIYAGPGGTEEEIVMATLDLSSLENLRTGVKTSIFEDRRPETYLPIVSGTIKNTMAYRAIGICGGAVIIFLGLWVWKLKRKT